LRFQEQRKGRIAPDIDPFDRVHLNGDVKAPAIGHVNARVRLEGCEARLQMMRQASRN
jgi:hypothetical protein